jgi:hypothetical protein
MILVTHELPILSRTWLVHSKVVASLKNNCINDLGSNFAMMGFEFKIAGLMRFLGQFALLKEDFIEQLCNSVGLIDHRLQIISNQSDNLYSRIVDGSNFT